MPADAATSLLLPKGKSLAQVAFSHIRYIEVDNKYCRIVTDADVYLVRTGIEALLPRLPPGFHRIHRSYVVSLEKVQAIGNGQLTIAGRSLPIARRERTRLYARFLKLG